MSGGVLVGQCQPAWQDANAIPGVRSTSTAVGAVEALHEWDPDGAGPATPVLVLGGGFRLAGDTETSNLATWDPATGVWGLLGSGVSGGTVHALATAANGDLLVAGEFTTAGSVTVNGIARWNGTAWSGFGTGAGGLRDIFAMTVLPNGDVCAGGTFTTIDGVAAERVARWNGTTWSALGAGVNGTVWAMTTLANGDLIAAGQFTLSGGSPVNRIARWNGTTWTNLGSGVNTTGGIVYDVVRLPNGDLVIGGSFTATGGVTTGGTARWSGSSWSALGTGMNSVQDLCVEPSGNLLAVGGNTAGGVTVNGIARWNGSAWSGFGATPAAGGASTRAVTTLANGDLCVGGGFTTVDGLAAANGVARWDGAAWHGLDAGMDGQPRVCCLLPGGGVAVGGSFTTAGGVAAQRIARWDGASWSAYGSGMDQPVRAIVRMPNGDLVAGGDFVSAGGTTCYRIARWNGMAWLPLGAGMGPSSAQWVSALAVLPNGDLVAGGNFTTAGGVACSRIARWNGSAWSPLGSGTNNTVFTLAVLPNGDLVAGGGFTTAGGVACNHVARWDGSVWSPFGSGHNSDVECLLVHSDGSLYAGGGFYGVMDRIARWDGSTWSPLGAGVSNGPSTPASVATMLELPDGDLLVGGAFLYAGGGLPANGVARWDGSNWSVFGSGLGQSSWWSAVSPYATALAQLPGGVVLVGGTFQKAGGLQSPFLAHLVTPCPATTLSYGSGCNSSVGPMALAVDSPPWIGGTFRATASGLAPLGLGFGLLSFLPQATPLSLLHPAGLPGCTLLVNPDVTMLLLPVAGTATAQFGMPSDPVYVGVVLRHQILQVEVDPFLQITGLSASDALQLTLGAF